MYLYTAHLNSEKPRFQCSIATWGHILDREASGDLSCRWKRGMSLPHPWPERKQLEWCPLLASVPLPDPPEVTQSTKMPLQTEDGGKCGVLPARWPKLVLQTHMLGEYEAGRQTCTVLKKKKLLAKTAKRDLLVHSSCCDKPPQSGGSTEICFLTILKARSPRPGVGRIASVCGLSPWLMDACPLPTSSHRLPLGLSVS